MIQSSNLIYRGILLVVMGMLLMPLVAEAQEQEGEKTEQNVEFNLHGETHMSNIQDPGLMLDLIQQLQQSDHLRHINVVSSQNIAANQDTNDTAVSQFSLDAQYSFNSYEEFHAWYQSDATRNHIKKLRNRLNELKLDLQLVKTW